MWKCFESLNSIVTTMVVTSTIVVILLYGKIQIPVPNKHVFWYHKDTVAPGVDPSVDAMVTSSDVDTWEDVVKEIAKDDIILISAVSNAYKEMALNMYLTSLQKHSISNYIYICYDNESFIYLQQESINLFYLKQNHTSKRMQILFNRFQFVYLALKMGLTVLHTDVDVFFFKDPFPYLINATRNVDFVSMIGGPGKRSYNAGFFFVKPTADTVALFEKTGDYKKYGGDDQTALNHIIKTSQGKDAQLEHKYFITTKPYYINKNGIPRNFAGDSPCTTCYAIHSTSCSLTEKVYKFKEDLMWQIDENRYYSNPDEHYLTYYTTRYSKPIQQLELLYGFMRLAKSLNRTLILPKFHCSYGYCNVQNILMENSQLYKCLCRASQYCKFADAGLFNGSFDILLFREHMFLHNPLVPQVIKTSVSPIHDINDHLQMTHKEKYTEIEVKKILVQTLLAAPEHVLNITLDNIDQNLLTAL